MHAVAAEQEAVMLRHWLARIVQPYLGLDAQRAQKDMRSAVAVLPHMVGGEAGQAIAAQPVSARVSDMNHMRDAPSQH